jgi:hypothetical protein
MKEADDRGEARAVVEAQRLDSAEAKRSGASKGGL